MKIDRLKLKSRPSRLIKDSESAASKILLGRFEACNQNRDELNELLKSITTWQFGLVTLNDWVDVFDQFDSILEEACLQTGKWILNCDREENVQLKELVVHILRFTALFLDYCCRRYLYNSMEHLITLLQSSHVDILLGVLSVFYSFANRSNEIDKQSIQIKEKLFNRLVYLAQCGTPVNLSYKMSSDQRLLWIQIRLRSLSILILSSAASQVKCLLHDNLTEELIEILHLSDAASVDVKTETLRTLKSFIHINRIYKNNEIPSYISKIIELTQADSSDGFITKIVRQTVDNLIDGNERDDCSAALFSFLYHLASYEKGAEALAKSQIIEPCIKLIDHGYQSKDLIQFVTRSIRIIHLLIEADTTLIQDNLLQCIIHCLQNQIKECRQDQYKIIDLTWYRQAMATLKSIILFFNTIPAETWMDMNTRQMIKDSIGNSLTEIVSHVEYYQLNLSKLALDLHITY